MKFQCLLTIHGHDLVPDDITNALGFSPARSGRRGEFVSKDHSARGAIREFGGWMLSTEPYVKSDDLGDHLSWLVDSIKPDRVLSIQSVDRVEVSILWHMACDSEEIEFSTKFLEFAAAIGAMLAVDTQYWSNKNDIEFAE